MNKNLNFCLYSYKQIMHWLEALTVAELKARCKQRGLTGYSKKNKEELVSFRRKPASPKLAPAND